MYSVRSLVYARSQSMAEIAIANILPGQQQGAFASLEITYNISDMFPLCYL